MSIEKNQIKVLFVDDESTIITLYKMYLSDFKSTYASSGPEALNCMQQESFDVVVTDYNMPQMTGYDLAVQIKKLSPATKIILMSAQIDKKLSMDFANKIRVYSMFDKPVDIESLEKAILDAYCELENERESAKMSIVAKNSGQLIHDISNSFFVMSLLVERGMNEVTDPVALEKFERFANICENNQKTAAKYKENLHGLNEEGHIQKVRVLEYLQAVGSELRVMMECQNMQYFERLDIDPNLSFNIDPHLFRQVLYNLAKNSVDEIRNKSEKPFIRLEALQNEFDDKLEIRLVDSGLGIPSDVVPKLFEEGFSTKGEKGTGMGLKYASKLLKIYNGNIWYDPVDGNTCFRMELPVTFDKMNVELPKHIPKNAELDPSLANKVDPQVKPESKVAS